MAEILSKMVDRYLELIEELVTVDKKEEFLEMVRLARDVVTLKEDREEAEAYILQASKDHGEMIIYGDQLTVDRIQSAKVLQKGAVTMLGRLDLVKVTQTGMFHADMSMIIYDYLALLDEDTDDEGSLNHFKLLTRWNHITNKPSTIKKSGKFEEHRQFLEGVGTEYLVEAIQNTIKNILEEGEEVEKTKIGATMFFDRIIKENKLQLFFDPQVFSPFIFFHFSPLLFILAGNTFCGSAGKWYKWVITQFSVCRTIRLFTA